MSSCGKRRPLAPILALPRELRQQIYTYLLPPQQVLHPLPGVGITSVSHRLPSAAILNIHPVLTDEILAYYYSIATWKLIFSHAFNFFRVDPDLAKLQRSTVLSRIRKVEVVFFCDILLLKDYPSFGLTQFCGEIRKRADRACDVLSGANELRSVTVSWVDTTQTAGWEEKAQILEPLRKLARCEGTVKFRVGDITGPPDVDRPLFIEAMKNVLGGDQALDVGYDGTNEIREQEEASRMRMIAFDVRQQPEVHGSPFQWGGQSTTLMTEATAA